MNMNMNNQNWESFYIDLTNNSYWSNVQLKWADYSQF